MTKTTTKAKEKQTVTMSPTEMKELDKHLTPEVECPKIEKKEETKKEKNKEEETTPTKLPTIDLFLNPDR